MSPTIAAAANISISIQPHIFIRNGGTINLTCTIVSEQSPDVVSWHYNGTLIATNQTQWQSKLRICTSEGMNCSIRTTFNIILKRANLEASGYYSCATENFQPANVYVEVLSDVVFSDGNIKDWAQRMIYGFAIEALELYGFRKVSD